MGEHSLARPFQTGTEAQCARASGVDLPAPWILDVTEGAEKHAGDGGHGFLPALLGAEVDETNAMRTLIADAYIEGAMRMGETIFKADLNAAHPKDIGLPRDLPGLLEWGYEVDETDQILCLQVRFFEKTPFVEPVVHERNLQRRQAHQGYPRHRVWDGPEKRQGGMEDALSGCHQPDVYLGY